MMAATPAFPRESFDHLGIPTATVKEGAVLLAEDGVWVTNPREHPLNVEWVHHLPESRMPERFRHEPHIAYRVDDLEPYVEACPLLVSPFEVPESGVRIAFVEVDGVIVELMQYPDRAKEGWVA